VLCKLNPYVVFVSLLGCIFSFAGITVDRYLDVSRLLKHKAWTKWTKIIIPTIWLAAILLPVNIWNETGVVYRDFCIDGRISIAMMITLATCCLLPFTVMLARYPIIGYRLWTRRVPGESNVHQHQKANLMSRKITKMMITVVFSFFVCWTPQFVFVWMHALALDLAASLP